MKYAIDALGVLLAAFAVAASSSAEVASLPSGVAAAASETTAAAKKVGAEKPKAEAEKPAEGEKKETATPSPESSSGAATHTVRKAPLKIEVGLDGHFEARDMSDVMVRTKVWTELEVLKGLEHGAKVKRGEVLVSFNTEKIDDAISGARADQRLAELVVKMAEVDLALLEHAAPIDLAAVDRSHQYAGQDYNRFRQVEVPLSRKSAELMLDTARQYVDSQKEELRQLEKMYNADDLTEETEEIILKRQRSAVKQAEFMLERTKAQYDEIMNVTLPRDEVKAQDSSRLEAFQHERAKEVLPLALEKARAELEKARLLQGKAEDKLKDLLADREAMVVKAPADGVLYYGRSTSGKFSGSDGEPLVRGDTVQPNQVFLTVVRTRPVQVCASVPEEKLYAVLPGVKGTVTPKGYPDLKADAVVTSVNTVPTGDGNYPARLNVSLDKQAGAVLPGMACRVKLVPYLKRDAIAVPQSAIETDQLDEQKHYVYVVRADGKGKQPEKRPVILGKKGDKETEILKGLSPGEKILLEPPKKD